ncbi:TPR repeat protein [Nostoc sp. NIES-3756]|uniref:tetratricopeptide repeat protein n=1 Tax=Nostoc sp. NIES-3756 TaxID=1751286 RepID=UPI000721D10F|nr:tetratricopeptide repeat protein [Nostoc sp. NIES-3756]BAT53245.1 TPR repeat protein [Nostoc sp. NIES-3756]
MKFTSVFYTLSALLLLGSSIPLVVAQIPNSQLSPDCQMPRPANLYSVNDFLAMGHFQQDCLKDLSAAVSTFIRAIKLNPYAEEPYYHRANAYAAMENYQAAVADYTQVIKKNTGRLGLTSPAYWNRARAYEKLGEKTKAISDLTQLIGNNRSPNPDEYFLRANLYKDLGNKQSAVADYKVTEKLLQQYLDGVFGTGHMDDRNQQMLDQTRKELASMGVAVTIPKVTTGSILRTIATTEVERALNLATFISSDPKIQYFDTQLEDLYQQLAITQPQVDQRVVKSLISNAAYEKMDSLKIERLQLLTKYTPDNPVIAMIDRQTTELESLIRRNKF